MDKNLQLIELFDLYGGLLTDRQKELFSSYYLYDLSLSEIAMPDGTTRQGVYEQLKKVKTKLNEYESTLKLNEKYTALFSLLKEEGNEELLLKVEEILKK